VEILGQPRHLHQAAEYEDCADGKVHADSYLARAPAEDWAMKRHKLKTLDVVLTEAACSMLDALVKEGTYGLTREKVARRMIEEMLSELKAAELMAIEPMIIS